jgi:hypothetical protein
MKTLTTLIIVLCMASFAAAGLQDGLVAHWTFDEGSGIIAYDSAGNNNGVIHDAKWTTGKFGGALDFDGDKDYVTVPDNDSLTPQYEMTISWWVLNRGGENATIYKDAWNPGGSGSPGNSRAYAFSLGIDGAVSMAIFSSVNTHDYIVSYDNSSLNEWHNIVGTFNRGKAALYVDGELAAFGSLVGVNSIMNDAQPLIIGGCWDYGGTPTFQSSLNGLADDIRIYNRALSAEEVAQLYAIPEPATIILLGIGWITLCKRYRKN